MLDKEKQFHDSKTENVNDTTSKQDANVESQDKEDNIQTCIIENAHGGDGKSAHNSKSKNFIIVCVAIVIGVGAIFASSNPGNTKHTLMITSIVHNAKQTTVTGYLDGTKKKQTVKTADMKGYKKLGNTSTVFTPAAISDANKMFANKETGVYLFGFETCPFCQSAVPVLNKAAKRAGWIVNYVDIYNQRFDKKGKKVQSTESDYVQLKKNMKGYIKDDTLYSPTVMFVKNGKIVDYQVSFMGLHVDGTKLTEEQAESLQKVYEDAFAKLV